LILEFGEPSIQIPPAPMAHSSRTGNMIAASTKHRSFQERGTWTVFTRKSCRKL
jgi:hypothetical protein